jgi:phosphatidate cytidylyltransferase
LSEVLIKRNTSLDNAPLLFFGGVFYTGFLLSHAIHIRFLPEGDKYIILLVTLVCGGDIGAYFAGNYLGKHKLLPKISPKKTFEGALGGLVTSIGIGICIKLWLLPQFTFLQILVIGTLLGVVGQIGDLIESILKRWIGVKDSGYIIPGHGGFLDVVDSLILATPFFYYYLIYFK